MPVFACPKCGTHLNVPDSAAGQTVGCPKCGQPLAIPAASTPTAITSVPPSAPAPQDPVFSSPLVQQYSRRLPSIALTRFSKPMLFALFGALGALIGAILVELPFYVASPKAAGAGKPQIDIMFVLDVTGSMQPQINGVRDGVKKFVRELQKQGLDVRVGLTYFRDRIEQRDEKSGRLLSRAEDPGTLLFHQQVFTDDVDEFSKQVGTLKEGGGGDPEESSLDALAFASRQPFRRDAVKVLLLITDEGPHIPDKEIQDVPHLIRELNKQRIDQLHLIVIRQLDLYKQIQQALPMKGLAFNLIEVAKGKGFHEALPEVSAQIGGTIRGVQSREVFAEESKGRLVFAVALWTAFVALGVSLALIIGQKLYERKDWRDWPALAKGSAGLAAGVLGGVVGQIVFSWGGGGAAWDILGRMLGWGLLGGLIGGGMALIVPNLPWWRGLLGGLLGGIAGVFGFLLFSLIGSLLGRWFGAALLGSCIGFMVALAEMAFRRWWLEVRYGPRETRTVTLGAVPIIVGGDERRATVVVEGAPPILLRYQLDDERVWCEDKTSGQKLALAPGDSRTVGKVTITVCNAATRRSAGLTLELSNGQSVPLSDGLPLTAEELPGLQAQGADGTVAIIQKRPSDPKTLLLLNRSRQPWTATEPEGAHRPVNPGMGIPVVPRTRINFGSVQGKVVREEG